MFIFLLLSLEVYIFPNPIKGKVGEKIPFTVKLLDEEGNPLSGKLSFDVTPNSLGEVYNEIFIAKEEGRGVLRCKAELKGETVQGFAYIRISKEEEKAKIFPSFAILEKGEKITFTISGSKAKTWKCFPPNIGDIENSSFIAKNPGKGRVIAILENGEVETAFIRVKGKVSSLKITPKFKKLKIGETVQFVAEEGVSWKIEGEKLGELTPTGLFTANLPGKTVIVAEKNGFQERAIVVISGEMGIRIIPEKVELKPGETVRFKLIGEGFRDINLPIRWEVIPRRCGTIKKDGTFIAGKIPTKGRVVAILPQRFGKGIVSAEVSIKSTEIKALSITPSFKYFDSQEIGREYSFTVENAEGILVKWKVIPEDLGYVNNNGVFIPKRVGAGFLVAEAGLGINVKPGRSLIVIGERNNIDSPTTELFSKDKDYNTSLTAIEKIVEGSTTPLLINTDFTDYQIIWKVIPEDAGRIILNREFEANNLPEGVGELKVKIIAILYRGREILAVVTKDIAIVKR